MTISTQGQVNLAIQILPLAVQTEEAYRLIDQAIEYIRSSGLRYVVSPFETVIEGTYEQVMGIVDDLQSVLAKEGAGSVIINLKIHRQFGHSVSIEDKIGKYQSDG